MADKLNIPFQPQVRSKTSPLSGQIQQIISQRGAFRNVSERILLDEISRPAQDSIDGQPIQSEDEATSDEDGPQTQNDKLWKSRAEILHKLSYAQNEILSALDFVSLLLSNHTPAAHSSMSPTLKDLVPLKTLDGRITQPHPLSTPHRERLHAVADGWKSESFRQASTKMAAASTRLEHQADRQSLYWEQIARLQDKGWSVSRFPNDSRAIGVHFGFQESAPQFRTKGFALLHQDDDGQLHLESGLLSSKRKTLRVAIVRNGKETGSYEFPSMMQSTNSDIESQLLAARDILFREELFFEVSREARLIANQNVQTQPQMVTADVGNDFQVHLIQCEPGTTSSTDGTKDDTRLAQIVAYCLQYLLLVEHQRLNDRRTQPPGPMTMGSTGNVEYAIFRPVLAQLRHEQSTATVTRLCQSYIPSFRSAGIPLVIDPEMNDSDVPTEDVHKFETLRLHRKSTIVLKVSHDTKISINVQTYLGSPLYGTSYVLDGSQFDFINIQKQQISNVEELQTSMTSLLELALVAHVKAWTERKSKTNSQAQKWVLMKPHAGEFLVTTEDQNVAKAVTSIQSRHIALQYLQSSTKLGPKAAKKAFLWTTDGVQSMPAEERRPSAAKSLDEVLGDIDQLLASG